jgi:hypothetical protein
MDKTNRSWTKTPSRTMKLFDKLFKANKTIEPADLTTVARVETVEGFSIPGIIFNLNYHYTDIDIYRDGLVDCWGMLDLKMFKEKLNRNWVVPSIPNNQFFFIFGLGMWEIDNGRWQHSKDSLYDYIYSLVKTLNPTLENLHDYHGNDSKIVGKMNIAKHAGQKPKPYYYEDPNAIFPEKSNGQKCSIFFRANDGKTYLAALSIYKNGRVEITNTPSKQIFQFDDLESLIKNGKLTSNPKIGEQITLLGLGSFELKSGEGIESQHKLGELTDAYNVLNGAENSIGKCARIFQEYLLHPTKLLKQALTDAYEALPEHRRVFVGTMDTKDYEVRQVIYGDIVKEKWKEIYGYDYPYEDMPKPIDE